MCSQLFRKELVKPPSTFTREDDILIHLKKIYEYLRVTDIKNDSDKVPVRAVYVLMESLQENFQKELRMMSDFQANQNDFNIVRDHCHQINLAHGGSHYAFPSFVEDEPNETPSECRRIRKRHKNNLTFMSLGSN